MAFLGNAKKVTLVDELGYEVPENPKNAQLADLVAKTDDYNEEFTKNILSRITADREEIEIRDREETEKQVACEIELKKLEIQTRNNTIHTFDK